MGCPWGQIEARTGGAAISAASEAETTSVLGRASKGWGSRTGWGCLLLELSGAVGVLAVGLPPELAEGAVGARWAPRRRRPEPGSGSG